MVLGTFLFAGLTTAFELVPAWLVKVLIDDVIQGQRLDLLGWVFAGLVAAYVLRNVSSSLRIRLNNTLEQQVVHDLHVQVFGALHGAAFVVYVVVSVVAAVRLRWSLGVLFWALVASIPTFCTLVFEVWARRRGLLDAPPAEAPAPA